jgi:hypothetical protein
LTVQLVLDGRGASAVMPRDPSVLVHVLDNEVLTGGVFVYIFGVSEVFRKNKKGGCYHPR